MLDDEINIVEKEMNTLLKVRGIRPSAFANHIRVLPISHRQLPGKIFLKISEAVLTKERLKMDYGSFKGEKKQREANPI